MSKFFKEKSLIPGISKNTFLEFNQRAGLNKRLDSFFLKQKHIYRFNKIVNKKVVEKKLKEKIKNNIIFLSNIKSYKGNRHRLKYPTRGQRTHTNAKTRKKKIQ
jgi:small subunit ribosomal protein S13